MSEVLGAVWACPHQCSSPRVEVRADDGQIVLLCKGCLAKVLFKIDAQPVLNVGRIAPGQPQGRMFLTCSVAPLWFSTLPIDHRRNAGH